ncbi:MAG: transposase [Bacteroidota bacterium]
MYREMIAEVSAEMKQLVGQEKALKSTTERLSSIHGIGWITALTIIAELDGFRLFTSRSQVVCYAGYDVVQKQSGSSLNGQGSISKRGNAHVRRALYMPSLTAISKPGIFKDVYDRIVDRTGKKQMALVAVQRKLLTTMYALQKNGTSYQENYSRTPKRRVGKHKGLPTVTTLQERVFGSQS